MIFRFFFNFLQTLLVRRGWSRLPLLIDVVAWRRARNLRGLGNQNHLYNHHPFKVAFQGGTIPKCKLHFLGHPLTVKLVAERPQVSFLWGRSSKYLQNVSLHFQGPPQNTLKNVAYILVTSHALKTVVIFCICIITITDFGNFQPWTMQLSGIQIAHVGNLLCIKPLQVVVAC